MTPGLLGWEGLRRIAVTLSIRCAIPENLES